MFSLHNVLHKRLNGQLSTGLYQESTATVTSHTTVGIDDDFTASQTTVTHWATDNKTASWVNKVFGALLNHSAGNTGFRISSCTASIQIWLANILNAVLTEQQHRYLRFCLVCHR